MLALGDEQFGAALLFSMGEYAVLAVCEQVNRAEGDVVAIFYAVEDGRELGSVVRLFAHDCTEESCLPAEVVVQLKAPTIATMFERAGSEYVRAGDYTVVLICVVR